MIREIIEAFKNWLRDVQPRLVPVPVRSERGQRNKLSQDSREPARLQFVTGRIASAMGITGILILLFVTSDTLIAGNIDANTHSSQDDETPVILFLGDSITAGYGIDESQAFPALIQEMIDKTGKKYRVINAGLSGETSAGGLRRMNWLLRSRVDILVLELGANDGLRGIDLSTTRQNLQAIIDRTKERYPDVIVVVAGMQVPPNLGSEYTRQFQQIFPDLAKSNNATLIPFILEGVAGIPSLNLPDGIHPTAEGHQIMAQTVWKILSPLL